MELGIEDATSSSPQDKPTYDQIFQALPALGSQEYLAHVGGATKEALPPEVLVRAFRQLPPGSTGSVKTLERLLGRRADGSWEYLGPLVSYARRRSRGNPKAHEDAFQNALQRILETLAGSRGQFAERAWNAFCRHAMIDAWRQQYGRRGERLPREEALEPGSESENSKPWTGIGAARRIQCSMKLDKTGTIERIAKEVVAGIPDEFVRAVAQAAWFENERPQVTATGVAEDGAVPLAAVFAGKSRYQIMRALRLADAQLAATLLADQTLDLGVDVEALLTTLRARGERRRNGARGRKK